MIAAALASACGRSATVRPSLSTNTRSAPFDDFLELGGDHQYAEALIGKLADERLNLGLGADVDAARGLVEDQELRIGAEPSRQQHLLLIAAGELANLLLGARRLDREALHEAVDDFALARLIDDSHARQARQDAERHVFAHRHVGNDAVRLAVLAAIADAERDRLGGLARRDGAGRPIRSFRRRADRRRKSRARLRCGRSRGGPRGRRSGARAPRRGRPAPCVRSEALRPTSTTSPAAAWAAENPVECARTVSRSRPSIAAMRCSLSTSAIRLAITVRPSRITVTRSQTW